MSGVQFEKVGVVEWVIWRVLGLVSFVGLITFAAPAGASGAFPHCCER